MTNLLNLLTVPKTKLPTNSSGFFAKILDILDDEKAKDHYENVLNALRICIANPSNSAFVHEELSDGEFIMKLLKKGLQEKSRPLAKKEFKLLALMLNNKPLRDIILDKPLARITEEVQASCSKGTCEIQWEGIYSFISGLCGIWPPIPIEKVCIFNKLNS